MPRKPAPPPRPHTTGYRAQTQANWEAQARIQKELASLSAGPLKSDAEARLMKLRTDLMALNVEMRLRTGQESGNA